MASYGFLVNDAVSAGITNTFTGILLHEDLVIDGNSSALPSSGHLAYLSFKADITAGAVTEVEAYLTWDSAGDELATVIDSCTGDSLVVGHTDTSLVSGIMVINKTFRVPSVQTTEGKMYLWIRASAGGGTMSLLTARVFYDNPHMRA